jgi:uroporphyrinogen-III decarboxylase
MQSRERVKRAIKFQKPDRVPISQAALPAAQLKHGQALNEILEVSPDVPLENIRAMYQAFREYSRY